MDVLDPQTLWLVSIFIIGYFFITIEHIIQIDKATTALFMGISCWVVLFAYNGKELCILSQDCLGHHLSGISQIIFFLLGALAIVAIINEHNGFAMIADALKIRSKRKLLWVIGFLTFFLSAILDNLTTTIVMVTLLSGLLQKSEDRLLIGGAVVIAANAGGAWTPIGDVTTTMLWIGGQVSSGAIIQALFLPSLVSLIASLAVLSYFFEGQFEIKEPAHKSELQPKGRFIFFLGIATLVFVPIFKILTGLPPFMGMLFGLSILWLVTDLFHRKHQDRTHLLVPHILSKIELSGLLFFLGILLAIDALDSAKILEQLAHWFDAHFSYPNYIAILIGLASAIVDNVPLVAAAMGMYSLEQFPVDDSFWQMVAFCAGTGGSILIIGSAAGVVFMGLEKVDFFWYTKRISLAALIGYFAGIGTYLLIPASS
jgi:NhaD family Na+/H+ antiporter